MNAVQVAKPLGRSSTPAGSPSEITKPPRGSLIYFARAGHKALLDGAIRGHDASWLAYLHAIVTKEATRGQPALELHCTDEGYCIPLQHCAHVIEDKT